MDAVREVQEIREGFHVIVEDVHKGICEIVDFIKKNHLIIKQLSTHQPKLEDAFLKIIERGGRD